MKALDNEKQVQILEASNRRLAIFGLFNPEHPKCQASAPLVFKTNPDLDKGEFRLSATELFEHLQPRYGLTANRRVKIGDKDFRVSTPVSPLLMRENEQQGSAKGSYQRMPLESPQYHPNSEEEGGDNKIVRRQDRGASLFEKLLGDLRQLAAFDGGDFASRLSDVARRYMLQYQIQEPGADVAIHEWDRVRYDFAASSAISGYMLAPQDDLHYRREQAREALAETGLLSATQVGQLIDGLEHCRRALESNGYNSILADLAAGGCGYLADYRNTAGASRVDEVNSNSFLDYYKHFLGVHDSINQLLRNPSLHSYLLAWVAAKYGATAGNFYQGAGSSWAKSAFEHGVEGQGDKRRRPQTNEESERNLKLVSEAMPSVGAQDETGIRDLKSFILGSLRPQTTFTATELQSANEGRFVALLGQVDGIQGQILVKASTAADTVAQLYHAARGLDKESSTIAQYAEALNQVRATAPPESDRLLASVVESVLEQLESSGLEGKALYQRAQEALVQSTAGVSFGEYTTGLDEHRDAIAEERKSAQRAYRGQSEAGGSRGAILATVPEILVQDAAADWSTEDRARWNASLTRDRVKAAEAQASQTVPLKVEVSAPAEVVEALSKSKLDTVSLVDAQQQELGVVEVGPGGASLLVQPAEGRGASDFRKQTDEATEAPMLKLGDSEEPLVVDLEAVGKRIDERRAKLAPEDAPVDELLAWRRSIQEHLDGADPRQSRFGRRYLALLLGEVMATAAPGFIHLGDADLANPLSLLLDLVEFWGDPKHVDPEAKLSAEELSEPNLSKHFPVDSIRDLIEVFQYHDRQCDDFEKSAKTYFEEVGALKALFASLEDATDAEVFVYNCTLAEHAEYADREEQDALFMCKASPSVCYLTSQSNADGGLRALAGTVLGDDGCLDSREANVQGLAGLQVPLFVCRSKGPAAARQVFPVVGPETLDLAEVQKGALAGGDPYLALAASALYGAPGCRAFGAFKQPGRLERKALRQEVNLRPSAGELAIDFLRRIWRDSERAGKLMPLYCATKWLNLCLLACLNPKDLRSSLVENCVALSAGLDRADVSKRWTAAFGPVSSEELVDSFLPRFNEPIPNGTTDGLAGWLLGASTEPLRIGNPEGQRVLTPDEVAFLKNFTLSLPSEGGGSAEEDGKQQSGS